tara:strand:+ start:158 stop:475 length:318 start_codon:yes stop_codon:yes gene_type:complete
MSEALLKRADKMKEGEVGGYLEYVTEAFLSVSSDINNKYIGEALGIIEMIGLEDRQEEAIKKGIKRAFRTVMEEYVDLILSMELGDLLEVVNKDLDKACGTDDVV